MQACADRSVRPSVRPSVGVNVRVSTYAQIDERLFNASKGVRVGGIGVAH